jgi:5-methylthioadenosine/S-adenosylhomocysteine deaminase
MLGIEGGRVLRPDLTVERADVRVDPASGEIVAVGADAASGTDERLDAADALVIPGLVNAHCHAAMTLLRGYADDKPLDAWLREDVWPIEGALEPADVYAGARLGCVEMLANGVTAFADMYFHVDRVVKAVRETGLRARVGHGVVTVGKDESAAAADAAESIEVAREFDGAAGGRVRTAVMPHSLTTVGTEHLRDLVAGARDAGVPLHYHASETRDEVAPIREAHGQRPLAYADDLGMLAPDDFLAHGVHLEKPEIDLLAERGAGVVHCPASNMKLASGAAPVPAMRAAGVPLALGTDGPASNNDLDPFDEARDAALLGKHASGDASAVPAEAVVRMATAGGADALGFDAGRIESGRRADLAVLDLAASHLAPDHDLVSHLAYAARGSDVRHTVVDGTVRVRDGEVLGVDAAAVRREATERARRAVERAA